jgi:hypothetical protein
VYDTKRQPIDIKELIDTNAFKGAKVTAIIQCLGIWVAGGKFGCSWKVLQMRVSPPQTIKGYAFKELEDDKADDSDIEDDDDTKANEIVANATEEIRNLNVDDEDDLIESSEDELDAPVRSSSAPKKKVIKK